MNVLISPAGTEIGREIWLSLRHEKNITLFLAGADYDNHARYSDLPYYILPGVNEDDWLPALQLFTEQHHIDYIFPAHDDALLAYAENQTVIAARIIAPSVQTCKLTRYKSKTYDALADVINVPKCYATADDIDSWPVFIKPDRGQGSQGARRADSLAQLGNVFNGSMLVSEYLPGAEFTVDCFSSRNGGLLYCQARTRERVRAGISMGSEFVSLDGIEIIAEKIQQKLQIFGVWFFQVKYAQNGQITLLEVAPRVAGTMALTRVSGANLPLLALYEHSEIPVTLLPQYKHVRISRALSNAFTHNITWSHVYVDYDDTLVIKNTVCVKLVAFLYQCINQGNRCHLVTRHAGDIHQELNTRRLAQIFDTVTHLTCGEKKSSVIKQRDAIFIDDSFTERLDVHQTIGIPTFDVSMLDLLIKE
ncbi:hypothetical protein A9B99_02570 [Mangrovibacter phragmitis]|uniref:ATP-grasp domain-containing protein n=1 Tax=Mangrovibacter phragmitis TaxID=1691903 RepID=A0A1B7LA71_9ENTR|nr:ATP-grasp domain-containing protein [Mangrovibacter phragmitis]OAT79219.1 hypothetical protein A9B99_02570 [Mangrovibacter phragmitis]